MRIRQTTSAFIRVHLRLILLTLIGVCAGCANSKYAAEENRAVAAYMHGAYGVAIETLAPIAVDPNESYVLNNLRLASAAMAAGDRDLAEQAFLRAYEVLNATRVNSAGRQTAAVVFDEKFRIWRGEPFERAVANFQLGVLYYSLGDYNNARGAFENALFKLRDYGDGDQPERFTELENRFPAALVMLGRTWLKLGRDDLAAASFRQLLESDSSYQATVSQLSSLSNNVLLVIDVGYAPRKVQDGPDGAVLSFFPSPASAGRIPRPRIIVDGQLLQDGATPLYDTVVMAADRRWQSIDTIRLSKSLIGTGLIAAGAGTTAYGINKDDQGAALAGVGMMIAGALLKASSRADTRTWEAAPRTTFVIPVTLPPGEHDLTIELPDAAHLTQRWQGIVAPPQGEAVYYFRLQRGVNGPFQMQKEEVRMMNGPPPS